MECSYGCKPSTWIVEFSSKLLAEQKMAIISSSLLAVRIEFVKMCLEIVNQCFQEITFYKMNKKGTTRTGCC